MILEALTISSLNKGETPSLVIKISLTSSLLKKFICNALGFVPNKAMLRTDFSKTSLRPSVNSKMPSKSFLPFFSLFLK